MQYHTIPLRLKILIISFWAETALLFAHNYILQVICFGSHALVRGLILICEFLDIYLLDCVEIDSHYFICHRDVIIILFFWLMSYLIYNIMYIVHGSYILCI